MRKLFLGDNLELLRSHIPENSVNLVYLDPPFNSGRAYTLAAENPRRRRTGPGVAAFEDTWHWDERSAAGLEALLAHREMGVAAAVAGLAGMLGRNGLMAYLVMMAARLLEVRRVLAPAGSVYVHCDAAAGHYLKILLDGLFGAGNFRNEIIWHYYNKYSAGKKIFPRAFDQIFFYSKGPRYTFNPLREPREKPVKQLVRENVGGVLKNKKDGAGRTITRWVTDRKVDSVWRIPCLQYASPEYLGFPTQKPLALLQRIIAASSDPGDLVLDPFCGCGTTLEAAEKLGRSWVGMEAAPLAVELSAARLSKAFPGMAFQTIGPPATVPETATPPALGRPGAEQRKALQAAQQAFDLGPAPEKKRRRRKAAGQVVPLAPKTRPAPHKGGASGTPAKAAPDAPPRPRGRAGRAR